MSAHTETKALFLDLDNTLLNDRKEITEGNRRAIEAMLAAGHKVIITTGRPLVSARIQAQRLGLTGPGCCLIAYNGCILYDTFAERVLFRDALSLEDTYALFDEARRRGMHIQTYDETCCLAQEGADLPSLERYCGNILMEYRIVSDIRSLQRRPEKVLLIDWNARKPLEDYRSWVYDRFGGRLDCNFSCPQYIEIVNRGRNKGTALLEMAELLGIPRENTYSAGDEENDLSMILSAGTGVAMCNGIPMVREAADYVTTCDNNHDGIEEIIDRFILC